jgi:hypothetical protein
MLQKRLWLCLSRGIFRDELFCHSGVALLEHHTTACDTLNTVKSLTENFLNFVEDAIAGIRDAAKAAVVMFVTWRFQRCTLLPLRCSTVRASHHCL